MKNVFATLKRFEYFNNTKNDITKFDYIFYLDVDMKIINPVKIKFLQTFVQLILVIRIQKISFNFPKYKFKSIYWRRRKINFKYLFCRGFLVVKRLSFKIN